MSSPWRQEGFSEKHEAEQEGRGPAESRGCGGGDERAHGQCRSAPQWAEKGLYPLGNLVDPGELALPNGQNREAHSAKVAPRLAVSLPISSSLGKPILGVRLRAPAAGAAAVRVPETAMHENDRVVFRENQVRAAGKVTAMQAKPVAQAMGRTPYDPLGLRVARPNGRHIP